MPVDERNHLAYRLRGQGHTWTEVEERVQAQGHHVLHLRSGVRAWCRRRGLMFPPPGSRSGGRPTGPNQARYQRWSPAEREIVRQAIATGRTAKDIEDRLPGRNRANIQNTFAAVRRELRGQCACGARLETGEGTNCGTCKARVRRERDAALAKGLCGTCQTRPADATLTRCSHCREIRARGVTRSKSSPGNASPGSSAGGGLAGCVRWLHTSTPGRLCSVLEMVGGSGWTFVDLFGGSGSFALWAGRRDWARVVYNDRHPMLVNLVREIQGPDHRRYHRVMSLLASMSPDNLLSRYDRIHAVQGLVAEAGLERAHAAALMSLVAHSVENRELRPGHRLLPVVQQMPRGHRRRLTELRCVLRRVEVFGEDAKDLLCRLDGPRTFFYLDPPWPGTTRYEYTMTPIEHELLASRLLGLQGHFLVSLGSSRQTLQLYGHLPHLAWSRSRYGAGRIILASSYPTGLESIDPVRFGFG